MGLREFYLYRRATCSQSWVVPHTVLSYRIPVARLRIPVSPYPRIPVSPYPRIPVAVVDFRTAPLLDVPTKANLGPFDKSSRTHSFHSGISLGDTVHTVLDGGIPASVLAVCTSPRDMTSAHFSQGHYHDTYRVGVSNILTSLEHGLRTIDSSIGGLGRCSYSPGATGNVATEDVLCTRRLET